MSYYSNLKHVILHAPPFWGHNKALITLAVFVVKARPTTVVTLLTSKALYKRSVEELQLKLNREDRDIIQAQINIVDVTGPTPDILSVQFARVYEALYNEPEHGVMCMSSRKILVNLPRPTVAVIDPYASYAYESIRHTSQGRVPILSWLSAPTAFLLHHIGPAKLGGHASHQYESAEGRREIKTLLSSPANQTDAAGVVTDSHASLLSGFNYATNMTRIMVPGAPPMFVHELMPQIRTSAPGELIAIGGVYLREGDGVIIASNSVYEGETVEAVKKWFSEMNKDSYALAPLTLPLPCNERCDLSEAEQEVLLFLNRIWDTFGSRSLVYISFGTFAYPPQAEKLHLLIESLITHDIPFLFSHPSPQATDSGDLQRIIGKSGIGLATAWCPQEDVLQHDVTGWFITHGGWNSIQESLQYRVPLILWPISADQPLNSAQLVLIHKAAFELIEVRSGEQGTGPMLRFLGGPYIPTFSMTAMKREFEELIKKLNGQEGQTIRMNFERLCDNMQESWQEGGDSSADFAQFIKKYIDCQ
ncbi:hypothetical protein F5880DRAFT_575102 [Lentinula raphanica]|nr:hypothetical protein F5880DRAFT_575102 [Lentinula raphanica]